MAEDSTCRWCGETHGQLCPIVKAFNFFESGEISRVEFLTAADFHKDTAEDEPAPRNYPKLKAMD